MNIALKFGALLGIIFPIIFLSGCSLTNEMRCRQWRSSGVQMGTLESCMTCIDTLGGYNPQAVAGCSLGLDAAEMMKPVEPTRNPIPGTSASETSQLRNAL